MFSTKDLFFYLYKKDSSVLDEYYVMNENDLIIYILKQNLLNDSRYIFNNDDQKFYMKNADDESDYI